MIEEKTITHGASRVDYGSERPRYRALARTIDSYFRDLLRPLEALQQRLETLLGLPDLAITKVDTETFHFNRTRQKAVDTALDTFLNTLAGPDRSEAGFVKGGIESDTADGIIQQHNILSYAVGLQRGSDLLHQPQTIAAARNNPATEHMLEKAFARLSAGGDLRLEGVRDDIHSILVSASEVGLNSLDTARQLSKQFDQYSGYEFQRLARTEAAYASEEGVREQLGELGVTHLVWLTSAGACPICTAYEGRAIEINDTDNLPPGHPSCLCASAPAGFGGLLLQ